MISWIFLVISLTLYFWVSTPKSRNLLLEFKPDYYKAINLTYQVQGKTLSSPVNNLELKDGVVGIPGGTLKSLEAILKDEVPTQKSEKILSYSKHSKSDGVFLDLNKDPKKERGLIYTGSSVMNKLSADSTYLHFTACLLSSFLLVTLFYALFFFIRLRPFPLKVTAFSSLVLLWLGYHLLVNWPGLIGYDGIIAYNDTFDLKISSFIQPLTTILNSALFNFIPHYAWNSIVTIFLMMIAFGLITHYMTKNKNVFYLFIGIFSYFLYSPLNIYTNLFISRDSIFSWLFFIATLFPVIITLNDNKKSIVTHFFFLFFFFLSLEIRKEVTILFPIAIWWSYRSLDYSNMRKNLMYASFLMAITISFFGNENFKESITAPGYQSVNLINPIADILSLKGLEILTEQEKSDLKTVVDLKKLTTNYIRHDLSNEAFSSLNSEMSQADFVTFLKLYLRLMKDYPDLWLKNRIEVLTGSLGLNALKPNYANNVLTEEHIPIEYYYNLHSMPYETFNIHYPSILMKWKAIHWDSKYEININRYLLLSFAIPLLLTACCLPFLRSAPSTALALFFNVARLITITPFMPASYIKYSYSAYLMLLFLPVFLMAEKNKTTKP